MGPLELLASQDKELYRHPDTSLGLVTQPSDPSLSPTKQNPPAPTVFLQILDSQTQLLGDDHELKLDIFCIVPTFHELCRIESSSQTTYFR